MKLTELKKTIACGEDSRHQFKQDISAPIRLFIFTDRIEIISPGNLPNHLTVDKIQAGNSNIRNPILASYVAKGLLPYKGLGSGIRRALENWSEIKFLDNREACTFTSIILRKTLQMGVNEAVNTENAPVNTENAPVNTKNAPVNTGNAPVNTNNAPAIHSNSEIQKQILSLIQNNAKVSYHEMASQLNKNRSTIMRNIQKLKQLNMISRIGSDKVGYWQIK